MKFYNLGVRPLLDCLPMELSRCCQVEHRKSSCPATRGGIALVILMEPYWSFGKTPLLQYSALKEPTDVPSQLPPVTCKFVAPTCVDLVQFVGFSGFAVVVKASENMGVKARVIN